MEPKISAGQGVEGYGSLDVARAYDVVYKLTERDDIKMYKEIAAQLKPSAILELGVGTGRLARPLACAGYEVWGLDLSEAMLQVAREKAKYLSKESRQRLNLVQGDMRNFNLKKRFDLVVIPLNTFPALVSEEDQVACLQAISRHLSRKGVLVIDVWNPGFLAYRLGVPGHDSSEEGEATQDPEAWAERVWGLKVGRDKRHLVLRFFADYLDGRDNLLMADRLHAVIDRKTQEPVMIDTIQIKLAVHTWTSMIDLIRAAGLEEFGAFQILGCYHMHPWIDLGCLTSGMAIKGTPKRRLIYVLGPGYKRVKPRPISPEEAVAESRRHVI